MRHLTALYTAAFWKVVFAVLLLALLAPATAGARAKKQVDIQILTISDWHAQLDPLSVFGEGTFGGAAELSTYWKMDRAAHPNSLTLTAGDAYGASPPLSNFFEEVPAVLSMNLMGFDADTFGNHNFDDGIDSLQNLIDLAEFQYVSANLKNRDDNLTGVKDFEIFDVGGVKVAVVGITNSDAAELVFPGSFGTIEVFDLKATIKRARRVRKEAKRAGAQVFILIAHQGVTGFDDDGKPFGPLIDIANKVANYDLILGDHTGVEFCGTFRDGKTLVVENRSRGRTYARVHLTAESRGPLRKGKFKVIEKSCEFVEPVSDAVTPDPAIVALLEPFRAELDVLLGNVLGESTVMIPRTDSCGQSAGRTCESLVGDVTTDALRDRYDTDFAITNSGGLRAPLTCPVIDLPTDFCPAFTGPNFCISDGQVLTVLPFGNTAVTLPLNGAELKTMLENGVSAMPGVSGRFAQVSGLCFTYNIDAAAGSRVTSAVRQAADGSCTGDAVDLTAASTYTIAENDFMAAGGDGYPDFSSRATSREFLDQVVADYVANNTPITPTIQGRIACTGSVCPITLP